MTRASRSSAVSGGVATKGLRCRAVAAAAVALLSFSQVAAILHAAFVGHAISPETGRLVHCDSARPGDAPGDDGAPHRDRSGDHEEECPVFAALYQTASVSAPLPPPVASARFVACSPALGIQILSPSRWALYLLAPSHSPPVV